MSEIKHTMPDVIYVGFESNAVHTMFPSWYSCTYKNSTSDTRTDIVQELVEALELALPRIEELHLVDLGAVRDAENWGDTARIKRARAELNETKGLIEQAQKALNKAKVL